MTSTLPDWIYVGANIVVCHTLANTFSTGTVRAISDDGTVTACWDYAVLEGVQQPLVRGDFVREEDDEFRFRDLDGSSRTEEVKTLLCPDDLHYLDWQIRHDVAALDVLARQAQRQVCRPTDLIDTLTDLGTAINIALTTANQLKDAR